MALNTTAAVAPIAPKKAEYAGHFSVTVDVMMMKIEKYRETLVENCKDQ
jgi:hypothetical protein